jgi:hypothetical protein
MPPAARNRFRDPAGTESEYHDTSPAAFRVALLSHLEANPQLMSSVISGRGNANQLLDKYSDKISRYQIRTLVRDSVQCAFNAYRYIDIVDYQKLAAELKKYLKANNLMAFWTIEVSSPRDVVGLCLHPGVKFNYSKYTRGITHQQNEVGRTIARAFLDADTSDDDDDGHDKDDDSDYTQSDGDSGNDSDSERKESHYRTPANRRRAPAGAPTTNRATNSSRGRGRAPGRGRVSSSDDDDTENVARALDFGRSSAARGRGRGRPRNAAARANGSVDVDALASALQSVM